MLEFVWIAVRNGERLLQDEADAATGADLWLCIETSDGHRRVYRGVHFQGDNGGFRIEPTFAAPEAHGTLTHSVTAPPKTW